MDPAGVFSTTYSQDKALVRTPKQWLALAAFLLFLALVPVLFQPRIVAIGNVLLITATVVMGLQITTGYAGQVNLGQAALMGVGAYTAGVMAGKFGLPLWLVIPCSGLSAALFGFVFGLSAVRIKGFYLALTTIAAQFIFHFAVLNLPNGWLGGSNGLSLQPASLGGFEFNTDAGIYYLCLVVTVIMVGGAYGIVRSRHGRAFVAVRDDDVAAAMMGINVVATKARAFLTGAFYAGIGGALWAYFIRFVAVDQFTMFNSIWYIAMIIVGGMGSMAGALIGVFVIRTVQELITSWGAVAAATIPFFDTGIIFASANVFLGGIIALFLILEPKGLMHRWNIVKRSFRIWPFPY